MDVFDTTHIAVIVGYLVVFIITWLFFEKRLNYVHKRHIEKIWPVGEDGLIALDRKLRIIVRLIFLGSFLVSTYVILTTFLTVV